MSLRRIRLIDDRDGACLRLSADGKSAALVLTEEQAQALGLALIGLVAAIRGGDAAGPVLVAAPGVRS